MLAQIEFGRWIISLLSKPLQPACPNPRMRAKRCITQQWHPAYSLTPVRLKPLNRHLQHQSLACPMQFGYNLMQPRQQLRSLDHFTPMQPALSLSPRLTPFPSLNVPITTLRKSFRCNSSFGEHNSSSLLPLFSLCVYSAVGQLAFAVVDF